MYGYRMTSVNKLSTALLFSNSSSNKKNNNDNHLFIGWHLGP